MWIKKLELSQFRNYEALSLDFQKGVNVIEGDNGEGKTSLVEAIALFPLSKSIRTTDDKEMIRLGGQFAKVECVVEKEFEEKLKIVISKQGKYVEINGSELKKISNLAGIVKVISFLPKDVELFKSSPSNRRRFIDSTISMLDRTYLLELSKYNKILDQIRILLKEEKVDQIHLEVLIKELSKLGIGIQTKRKSFIDALNEEIKVMSKYLEEDENKMKLIYCPDIGDEEENVYYSKVWDKLKQTLEMNKMARNLIKGIHQDDILMNFNEKDLATYGSQGQNRIAVIALKLSLVRMIKLKFKEEPIVILDDVLSELDELHQKKLIQLLNRIEQVFITGTKIYLIEKYALYNVKDNVVRRIK